MAVDSVLKAAVDVARDAAVDVAEDAAAVGAHLSAHAEDDKLVTHLFACTLPGYRGWVWSVTLSRAPRTKVAQVCEAHLVPADDALLAPSWVPWAERIQPGDLEPSMVLPRIEQDPRIVAGYEATGEDEIDELAIWELGLGRERVLGPQGRDLAVDRWYRGSHGPTAASAIASTSPCSTCAFFVPLSGAFRTTFGACANEWSSSDGKVVSVDHGCGAHSETDVERQATQWPADDPVYVDDVSEPFDLTVPPEPEPEPEAETEAETAPEREAGLDAGAESPAQDPADPDELGQYAAEPEKADAPVLEAPESATEATEPNTESPETRDAVAEAAGSDEPAADLEPDGERTAE